MYTIHDLEWLTLEITASRRMDVVAVLMSPERAVELEEMAARRPPGELIPDTEVPLSLVARQAAERSVARDADDPDTLRILANSPFAKVREDVAGNPATPPDVLVTLASRDEGFIASTATKNPSFPVEDLEVVGVMGRRAARWGAILNPRAPQWLIEHAGSDEYWPIRQAAAHSALVSLKTLLALSADTEGAVRASAAKNLNLPNEVLHRLATTDPDEGVRAAAAANPTISEATLLALAGDEVPWVRAAVAKSRDITPLVTELLSGDSQEYVRKALAANPSCPEVTLTLLAHRRQPACIREQVAANSSCSPDVRRRLREKDRSVHVRRAAERRFA